MTAFVENTLPKLENGEILSESILSSEISPKRECVGISNGFCFCDLFENKQITQHLLKNDQKYIDLVIETINNLTGNGRWNCLKLDPNDFTVSLHMINSAGNIEIIVQEKDNEQNQDADNDKRLLSVLVYINLNKNDFSIPLENHSIGKLPKIIRIDLFKYENCLTTNYESYQHRFGDSVEPIFIDKNMTINMLKYNETYNLRLCKCK